MTLKDIMIFKVLNFIIILIIYLSGIYNLDIQNLNILFINEVDNYQATQGVKIAMEYVRKNENLGQSVELITVEGNRSDRNIRTFLEAICNRYARAIAENQSPHLILDTTTTSYFSETVKSVSMALALPTVSVSIDRKDENKNFFLKVILPINLISEVIRSLVEYMNITNLAILHDQTFGRNFQDLLNNLSVRYVIIKITKNFRQNEMDQLRKFNIHNFFILGNLTTITGVLESARPEYFKRNFAWYAITQSIGDLSCKCDNSTIIFIKPNGKVNENNSSKDIMIEFYFNLALRSFLTVKEMILDSSWPSDMNYLHCVDFNGTNTPNRTLDLKSYFMKISEPSTTVTQSGSFFTKFNMDVNSVTIQNGVLSDRKTLGQWTTGFNESLRITDMEAMVNLKPSIIHRVVLVEQPPFVIRASTSPKGFKGYCIDMIDAIAEIVGFDYEIELQEDEQFGRMDENGEWDGMVRRLMDREADIALGTMSLMSERERVIDFTVPYYELVGYNIMLVRPTNSGHIFQYVTVLESDVWLLILGVYILTSLLIWFFERHSTREGYSTEKYKRKFTLRESFWFCLASITPQGGGEPPKSLSSRILAITWWLFGFIMIASYTANLAAYLTVSRLETPIDSLDDLYEQYDILYAPINGSAAMEYFIRMAQIEARIFEIYMDMAIDETKMYKYAVWDYSALTDKYTKMWQAMQDAGLPQTLNEAVARVKSSTVSSGFAFIGEATDIKYKVMTNCDLQMVGTELSRKPYAIALQDGSPLKEPFDKALEQLMITQKFKELKEKWWWTETGYRMNCNDVEDRANEISIRGLGGVFVIILIGIGVASVILIFELFWFKYVKKPEIIVEKPNLDFEPVFGSNKLILADVGKLHCKNLAEKRRHRRRARNNETVLN